jgi:type III pantothenate kinase
VIAAGLQTGLWALHARTAQLPELMPEPTDCLIGKNTKACMESGALYGQAAMIDGIVKRVEKTLGRPVSLVVTGGWSEEVHRKLTHSYLYEPELMLKGLAYQWEMAGEGQKLSHNVQV